MGRRRKDNGVGRELLFDAVAYSWRSPPYKAALTGVAIAVAFCGGVPFLLTLAMPAQSERDGIAIITTWAVRSLATAVSKYSIWAGVGGGVFFFGCAAINLLRGQKHVNRAGFAAKFADFAIVDPDTGDVLAIIELDDHTHDAPDRQDADAARDAGKRSALRCTGSMPVR